MIHAFIYSWISFCWCLWFGSWTALHWTDLRWPETNQVLFQTRQLELKRNIPSSFLMSRWSRPRYSHLKLSTILFRWSSTNCYHLVLSEGLKGPAHILTGLNTNQTTCFRDGCARCQPSYPQPISLPFNWWELERKCRQRPNGCWCVSTLEWK